MADFKKARENMMDGQVHPFGVVDEKILDVFATVPRELFVPEKLQSVAYIDEDLEIGRGRYLMESKVHAKMLQALDLNETDVALDIGVASGYSSVILSHLVTTVIALENDKAYIEQATKTWQNQNVNNAVMVGGAFDAGAEEHAPYNVIVLNGAVEFVSQTILDQLEVGGRLVTIIRKNQYDVGCVTLFLKSQSGSVSSTPLFDASTPYLQGFEPLKKFAF